MDAIKATFCNFKNIAGRKVVQLIFEIPVEQASQAYETLGWPNLVKHFVQFGLR